MPNISNYSFGTKIDVFVTIIMLVWLKPIFEKFDFLLMLEGC